MWANYLQDKIKNGKLSIVIDSGIFVDAKDYASKTNLFKEKYANLMKIANK
jgi:hypothetical protein